MELLNQTILALFALILLGVLSSTGFRANVITGANLGNHRYWLSSITCRAVAFLAWAVSTESIFFKITANAFYTASIVFLVLFIRSWRQLNNVRLLAALGLLWIGFLISLAYLLTQPDTYTQRYLLTGSWTVIGSVWEYLETQRASRTNTSYLLRILKGIIGLQCLIAIVGLATMFASGPPQSASNFVQSGNQAATLFLWITFSVHLLSYIIINSYLYEQLRISERLTYQQLLDKQAELNTTTRENEEIRQLLQERENLIAGLIKANKSITTGAMAAGIAHEMAQPLAVIRMNAEFLDKICQQQPVEPELLNKMISGIRTNNEHAANIVSTLRGIFLDKPPVFARTNLRQLVDGVIQLARSTLDRQGIALSIDIPDNLSIELYPNEIFQLLINLLNNATQALAKNTSGEKRLTIKADVENNGLTLHIVDTGPGISPDLEPRLFQLFEHGGADASMGLGLWLCAYITERHHGTIRYQANPGGGACFIIQLPLSQTDSSSSAETEERLGIL